MAFDNHRAVGWRHARHLEVVPRSLADGGAGSHACRDGLCGFLLRVRRDDTPTALKKTSKHTYF